MSDSQSRGVFVQFYTDSVELKLESETQGRPIFKDMPHIRKLIPGDNSTVIERVAKPYDIQQYPKEWELFKSQTGGNVIGTPLEQWPQITRSQVKEARYFEVHTVEQLSELSDVVCQKLGMGYLELRNKAKAYLLAASGTAQFTAQEAENQRLKDEISALKAQVESIAHRGPGRPKKELVEE